jgi:hypothetical protein
VILLALMLTNGVVAGGIGMEAAAVVILLLTEKVFAVMKLTALMTVTTTIPPPQLIKTVRHTRERAPRKQRLTTHLGCR